MGNDWPAQVRRQERRRTHPVLQRQVQDEAFNAKAEAAGWKGSELNVNADIIVLANPEIALLPDWVIALVAAGGLAAALSTAAGLLMAISPPSRMT